MRREHWDELNQLGIEWYYACGGQKQSKAMEIAELLFRVECPHVSGSTRYGEAGEIEEKNGEYIGYFFETKLVGFDPNKSPLSAYYNQMKSYYEQQTKYGDAETHRISKKRGELSEDDPRYCPAGPEAEQTVRIIVPQDTVSYTVTNTDQTEQSSSGTEQQYSLQLSTEDMYFAEDVPIEILLLIEGAIVFAQSSRKSARVNHYRTFFTQDISYYLRSFGCAASIKHERETLTVMKTGFLDFTLVSICRSFSEIARSKLKLYGEMVEGKAMKELPEKTSDLPLDVYTTYYSCVEATKIGNSSLSEQIKNYREFKRQLITEN